jgi:hypothetical protein
MLDLFRNNACFYSCNGPYDPFPKHREGNNATDLLHASPESDKFQGISLSPTVEGLAFEVLALDLALALVS